MLKKVDTTIHYSYLYTSSVYGKTEIDAEVVKHGKKKEVIIWVRVNACTVTKHMFDSYLIADPTEESIKAFIENVIKSGELDEQIDLFSAVNDVIDDYESALYENGSCSNESVFESLSDTDGKECNKESGNYFKADTEICVNVFTDADGKEHKALECRKR